MTDWRRAIAPVLVSAALLAGCSVGPDFARPDKPKADGYTPETLAPQTASAAADGGAAQTFIHGKDITIPNGTEVPTFINGNFALDMTKFNSATPVQTPAEKQDKSNSEVAVSSTPAGADIDLDGTFVGSTPSTIPVTPGDHTITVKKPGFTAWERKIKVTGGKIQISAELEASEGTQPQPQPAQ